MQEQRRALPDRLLPFSFHFFRQFRWGCLGLLLFPVLGRAVFASIAYSTRWLTDTVLGMHGPVAEAGHALVAPFTLFAGLVVARFVLDGLMWFCYYHKRSPMLVRMKEEVFANAQQHTPNNNKNTQTKKNTHHTKKQPKKVLIL